MVERGVSEGSQPMPMPFFCSQPDGRAMLPDETTLLLPVVLLALVTESWEKALPVPVPAPVPEVEPEPEPEPEPEDFCLLDFSFGYWLGSPYLLESPPLYGFDPVDPAWYEDLVVDGVYPSLDHDSLVYGA